MSPDSDKPNFPNSDGSKSGTETKECPICKFKFEGKMKGEASQKLADHIQKEHPEPKTEPKPVVDPELPNENKKKHSLECHHCGHLVETDTEQKAKELMQIHIISHDKNPAKKEDTGNNLMLYIGITAIFITAGIILGALYLHSKKSLSDDTKEKSK